MRRRVGALLGGLILAAAWFALAPRAVGGSVSYVITSGTSMEPRVHEGDLVLVRPRDRYVVGQVVAYRSPTLGRVVLHRIVGRDGDRFVLKGDNNSWLDGDRPHRRALIGRLWVRVPAAGKVLGWPRRLPVALVLGGVLALAALGVRGRRRKGGAVHPSPPRLRPKGAPGAAIAASTAGALALGLSAFTVIALASPGRRTVEATLSYRQSGRFDYSARAPARTVYPGGRVGTGDPVFLNLVHALGVRFSYALDAGEPTQAGGTGRLDLEVSGADGWRRVVPIQPPTTFTGGRFVASGTVDLERIRRLLHRVEELTGIQRDAYVLAVVPRVEVAGSIGGRRFDASFTPRLAFRLDALELQLDRAGERSPNGALTPAATGSVGVKRTEPNRLSLLGARIPVDAARHAGAVGAAICVLAAVAFARRARRTSTDEAAAIRRRLAPWLVPARGLAPGPGWVEVASIDGLIRLADASGGPVLFEEREDEHVFALRDGGLWYAYRLRANVSPNGHGRITREAARG